MENWGASAIGGAGRPDGVMDLCWVTLLYLPDDGVLSPGDQQPYGYLPLNHAAGWIALSSKGAAVRDRKRLYRAGGLSRKLGVTVAGLWR